MQVRNDHECMRALLLILALAVVAACRPEVEEPPPGFGQLLGGGTGGSAGGSGGGTTGGGGSSGGGNAVPSKRFPGVVPTGVTTGAYWDVASRTEGFGKTYLFGYRMTLGRAVTLEGVSGFEVSHSVLWWSASDGVGDPVLPSVRYLSFTDGRIRKRGASGPWKTVFSEYGGFEGVYFFEQGDQTEEPRDAEVLDMSTALRSETSVPTVSRVLSSSSCTYYPELGQTICRAGTSGGSETAIGRGYFEYGEGFIGHSQRNCISAGCLTEEVAVVRWSPSGPAPACSGEGACCRALGVSASACPTPFCSDPAYPTECPASGTFARACWGPNVACDTRTRCGTTVNACSSSTRAVDCSLQTCAEKSTCTAVPANSCGTCSQTYCCGRVAAFRQSGRCEAAWALADCLDAHCGGCRFPPEECAIQ
jgi:hypothetical protein